MLLVLYLFLATSFFSNLSAFIVINSNSITAFSPQINHSDFFDAPFLAKKLDKKDFFSKDKNHLTATWPIGICWQHGFYNYPASFSLGAGLSECNRLNAHITARSFLKHNNPYLKRLEFVTRLALCDIASQTKFYSEGKIYESQSDKNLMLESAFGCNFIAIPKHLTIGCFGEFSLINHHKLMPKIFAAGALAEFELIQDSLFLGARAKLINFNFPVPQKKILKNSLYEFTGFVRVKSFRFLNNPNLPELSINFSQLFCLDDSAYVASKTSIKLQCLAPF